MQGIDCYEESDTLMLNEFVLEHRQLVKKIALHMKRKLPAHIDLDDLLQSGFVGLLEARRHYRHGMGATFETFASIRIRGAIIDALRKNSWSNREVIKQIRLLNETISRLEQRNQRTPSTEEIAAELGVSLDEYNEICQQISLSNIISIDNFDNEAIDQDKMDDPQDLTQHEEMLERLKKVIPTLPEREQLVLSLYYVEEFTFKQIGEILDLTEARICQLHSQSIARIQNKFNKENE